ncbi:MAG: WYL domain-containing transcriptional regulator [Mariprofundaceae bacterium]
MKSGKHDTLVYRLAQILIKLNQGESLYPNALADEFGVSLRTIQRDLNVRFAYLPLEHKNRSYALDPCFLGKLSNRDIKDFANLAGVRGLFPSLSDRFLRDIFDQHIEPSFLVKGHHYEDLSGKEGEFHSLEKAISKSQHISFHYQKEEGVKHYSIIEPYKLMNHKGIWYLACKDGGKLKTFLFSRIRSVQLANKTFSPDPSVDDTLLKEDGIWFGSEKQEITLSIGHEVAAYFKRRKLIANQTIEEELEDGSLILSTKVGHVNQVLPIVRYWIPHIRIIRPVSMQLELESTLVTYIDRHYAGGSE